MNSNDSPGSDVDTRPVTLPAVAPLATVRDPPDAPRVQTVPATPAARSRRSTQSSASVPASVQVLDKLGELAGILVIGALCLLGRVDGMVAVGAILAIVGVNAGLRKVGDRVAGPGQGLGVIGLLVAAASGYGAQLLQGARVALPALLGVLSALLLICLGACRPNLPPVSGCEPNATSCRDGRPAVCSPSQRWHVPERACASVGAVCVEQPVAHCAPAPSTATPSPATSSTSSSPAPTDAPVGDGGVE